MNWLKKNELGAANVLEKVAGEHPETKNVLAQVEKREELEAKKKKGHTSILSWELSPRDDQSRIWVEAPRRKRTSDKGDGLVPRQLRITPEIDTFLRENCNGSANTVMLALLMYAVDDIKNKGKLLEVKHSQPSAPEATPSEENDSL